jgi:RNA polymerase sigma-70 factor, ECF subfamily
MAIRTTSIHISSESDTYERFTTLLVLAQPGVYAFILTLLPRRAEAEDVLQTTSVIAWKKFDFYRPGTNFTHWMCEIAKLEVFNYRRVRHRDRHVFSHELLELLADEQEREHEGLAAEREALHLCIGKLKESDRLLLQQCLSPDICVNEMARRLGRTSNSLYKWLGRIRIALLRCIEQTLGVSGCR